MQPAGEKSESAERSSGAGLLSEPSGTSRVKCGAAGGMQRRFKAPLCSFSLLAPPSVFEVFNVYFSVVNTQLR